jgi:WD40 repeat protein
MLEARLREAKSEPLGKHSLGDALAAGFELVVNWAEQKKVWSVAYSPDGSTLASESTDRTIKLWDVASGRVRRTLSGHRERVLSIAFAPDGSTLASGSLDGTIKFWDLASGMSLRTFSEYKDYVRSVVFLPDGSTLALGSDENPITLRDLETGRVLQQLWGHENDVTSLAFSPDGWFLAWASYDKTIILWWVCNGTIAARFIAKGPLGSITLDGKVLPIAVSGNEEAIYHFVKNDEVVSVSEMRALGYDLPVPDAPVGANRLTRQSGSLA